jgi:hypothetical protein
VASEEIERGIDDAGLRRTVRSGLHETGGRRLKRTHAKRVDDPLAFSSRSATLEPANRLSTTRPPASSNPIPKIPGMGLHDTDQRQASHAKARGGDG